MIKVTYKNNTLTVTTDISTKVFARARHNQRSVKDEKGNDLFSAYVVPYAADSASLTKTSIPFNTVDDNDCVGLTAVMPVGYTKEDLLNQFGESLLAAKKYLPIIAAAAATEEADLEALLDD